VLPQEFNVELWEYEMKKRKDYFWHEYTSELIRSVYYDALGIRTDREKEFVNDFIEKNFEFDE
jgi:hypothetical protein